MITKIITLAAVNAMNPCALAAMVMVLISILVANPEKRHKVLLGGLSFTSAIFIGYFLYGIILIQVFKKFFEIASIVSPYLTYALGILSIILGILNVKDYFSYSPGGLATEMPLRFRPRMRQIIKAITSPKGAFLAGVFVTVFLLPCTIGPYLIALGSMSSMSFIATIPLILLYDVIFILPMIILTFLIYWGFSSAEKVGEWRDRNIKKIHLVAGIILILLGIAIVTKLI